MYNFPPLAACLFWAPTGMYVTLWRPLNQTSWLSQLREGLQTAEISSQKLEFLKRSPWGNRNDSEYVPPTWGNVLIKALIPFPSEHKMLLQDGGKEKLKWTQGES